MMNDERGMKDKGFSIHHSACIVYSDPPATAGGTDKVVKVNCFYKWSLQWPLVSCVFFNFTSKEIVYAFIQSVQSLSFLTLLLSNACAQCSDNHRLPRDEDGQARRRRRVG